VTRAKQPEVQEDTSAQEFPVEVEVVQTKASPLAAAKRRQEMQQNAVPTDLEKAPKQTVKKKVFSATGVVSRDREALARLLTSF
jgi:hypothetical protein